MSLVPAPFLFRYSLPVRRLGGSGRSKAGVLRLSDEHRLPWPVALDPETAPFAEFALGWNELGLAFQVQVRGLSKSPQCPADYNFPGDRVWLWIDTRNTQGAHRASRFSHHFIAMPLGGGKDRKSPLIRQHPIARAREDSPTENVAQIQSAAEIGKDSYRLNLWFPSETLHGYDPESQRRLGFYLAVQDAQRGVLPLVVGAGFPFDSDPSQWVTLELRFDS